MGLTQNCHSIELALVVFPIEGPLFQSLSLRRVGWKWGDKKLSSTVLHPVRATLKPRWPLRDTSRRHMVLASGKSIYSRGNQKEWILSLEGVLPQALPEKKATEAADGE